MDHTELKHQLIAWRHYLHQHPESAFEETNTAQFVAERLTEMGLQVYRDIGKTGVVGVLKQGDGTGVIAIRADMDCIELTEQSDLEYKSCTINRMHACGHDGHTCIGLGAAKVLSQSKAFNGTVVFVFQPAEEPGKGAKAMLQDGLIERFGIQEIYGLHNMPGMKAGTIATRIGGIMGSEDNFVIRLTGQGAHAARPHMAKDPLVTAAEIIVALQTIVARNIDPSISAVISCTQIDTDGIRNAIPTHVTIKGDTRSHDIHTQQLIEQRMQSICQHIAMMNEVACEFEYTHEFAPTVNHEACYQTALQAAINVVGENNVDGNVTPMMISEDFGAFLQAIPGCFVFLGNGTQEDGCGYLPLHNSKYDFNDDILMTGVAFFEEIVRIKLPNNVS